MSNSAEPAVGSEDEDGDDGSTTLGPDLQNWLDSSGTAGMVRPSFSEDSLDTSFTLRSLLHGDSPTHLANDHSTDPLSCLEPVATQHMAEAIQSPKRDFEQTTSTDWSKKQRTSRPGSLSVAPIVSVGAMATSATEVSLETRVHNNNNSSKKSESGSSGRGSYLCGDCGKVKKGHICEVGKSRAKPPSGITVMTQTATPHCPEGDTWSAAPVPLWRSHLYAGKYKPVSKALPPTSRKKDTSTMLEDSIALAIWLVNKWKSGALPGGAMQEETPKSLVSGRKVEGVGETKKCSNAQLEDQDIDESEYQQIESDGGVGLVPPALEPNVGSSKDDEEEEGGIEVVAV